MLLQLCLYKHQIIFAQKWQIVGTIIATGLAASSDALFAAGEDKPMTYLDKMVKRLSTLENMLGQSGFPSTALLQSPAITSLLSVLRNKYSANPVFVTPRRSLVYNTC